jgi:hypothetical protein
MVKGEPGFIRQLEDHECRVPSTSLDIGLRSIYRCSCGKRYILCYWGGKRRWDRRYWPWPR